VHIPRQEVVAWCADLKGRHAAKHGIGPERILPVLLLVNLRLMNGSLPVDHVTLIDYFAFQCLLAKDGSDHQKNNKSNEVRQQSGKEAFLHIGFFKRDKISPFELILFMRWLLFLSRLAFICNVFFLLAVSLQLMRWFQNQDVEAYVIIIGYFMVGLINPLANFSCLFLFLNNRARLKVVPTWLLLANFVFFILQIIYLIYLNGTEHP